MAVDSRRQYTITTKDRKLANTEQYKNIMAELAEEGQVDHVEVWFNFEVKLWTVQNMDKNDNQIGEAQYAYYKNDALGLASESNVKIVVENKGNGAKKVLTNHIKSITELTQYRLKYGG